MIFPWNRKANEFCKAYPNILISLEQGDTKVVEELLWQPATNEIKYLPVTYDMLLEFKRPDNSTQTLTIHKTFDKGNFQLIVFEIPWLEKNTKFSPLLFDKSVSKIVGVMLPFNELNGHFSKKAVSDMSSLGIEWTKFIITAQSKS